MQIITAIDPESILDNHIIADSFKGKFILHAPNVHTGGGWVLLKALLTALAKRKIKTHALLDARISTLPIISDDMIVQQYAPTLKERMRAESHLKATAKNGDIVLCFGNLPPMFTLSAKVFLFLQNYNLLHWNKPNIINFRIGIRIAIEQLWLRLLKNKVDVYIVQTPSMYNALYKMMSQKKPIKIKAFLEKKITYSREIKEIFNNTKKYDFLYVASGDPHKNHRNLIEAWKLLAKQGFYPSLCLTLDTQKSAKMCQWIAGQSSEYKLNIINLDKLDYGKVQDLYLQCRALIFPSISESLGLPLVEARVAGLPILAGELDFIRDTLDPEQTFDPKSPISISRAVARFLKIEQDPLALADSDEFLQMLLTT